MTSDPNDPITSDVGTVDGHDRTRIAYVRWTLSGPPTGLVLVFLHGIGSYGEPYGHMVEGFRGVVDAVYMPDMRGHGRSEGVRGQLTSRRAVLADIAAVVAAARRDNPGARLVLGGESMGALFALGFADKHAADMAGLLLVSPAIALNWCSLLGSTTIADSMGDIDVLAKGVRVQGGVGGETPRDPGFYERVRNDPLMLQRVGLRYLAVVQSFRWDWFARYRRTVRLPVLILQGGEDRLVDVRAVRVLDALLRRSRMREFPDAWHNLFWDPETPAAVAAIAEWLRQVAGGTSAPARERVGIVDALARAWHAFTRKPAAAAR
jgi:alpha-beta hydrolase superfamily lysophospholipase